MAELVEMEDSLRSSLLPLSEEELRDLVEACNRFPSIDLSFQKLSPGDGEKAHPGDSVTLLVQLEREIEEGEEENPISSQVWAPRFPQKRDEGWWLVVGDPETNSLLAIKRLALQKKAKAKLTFELPQEISGTEKNFMLYLISDSYLGVDQEYPVTVEIDSEGKREEGGDMEED